MYKILASLILLTLPHTFAYKWLQFESEDGYPENTYTMGGKYAYCKVSENGTQYIGVVNEIEKFCVVVNTHEESIKKHKSFQVFVKEPHEIFRMKYGVGPKVPYFSVSCRDAHLPSCYLAHSVYGDGICYEMLGKASPALKTVYYPTPSGKFESCPFVMYLTCKTKYGRSCKELRI